MILELIGILIVGGIIYLGIKIIIKISSTPLIKKITLKIKETKNKLKIERTEQKENKKKLIKWEKFQKKLYRIDDEM